MIKPFNVIKEDVVDDGTVVLYNATKVSKAEGGAVSKKKITATMFVAEGLDIEQELVKLLRQGGWL